MRRHGWIGAAAVSALLLHCGGSTPPPKPAAQKSPPPPAANPDSVVLEQIALFSKQLQKQLSQSDKKLRVAIMPFTDTDGRSNGLGKYVSEKVLTDLGRSDHYDLIERARLDQVTKELKLSSSSLISDETAASLGNMLGADALVIGTFTDLGSAFDLNCRVVAPETGVILGAASTTFSRSPMVDHLWGGPPQAPNNNTNNRITAPPLVRGATPAQVELATNRPGQDYRSFELEERTADACQRICAVEDMCKSFTFMPPPAGGQRGRCWLKKTVPAAVGDARFISGVKTDAMLALVRPASASADRKVFNRPSLGGHPIDVCFKPGNCWQGAADAWCRQQGYARAWHFVVATDIGDRTPTVLQGDPKHICDKHFCDGFSTVTCAR